MPAPVDAGKDEVVPVRDEVGVEVDVAKAAERGKQPRARGWEVVVSGCEPEQTVRAAYLRAAAPVQRQLPEVEIDLQRNKFHADARSSCISMASESTDVCDELGNAYHIGYDDIGLSIVNVY